MSSPGAKERIMFSNVHLGNLINANSNRVQGSIPISNIQHIFSRLQIVNQNIAIDPCQTRLQGFNFVLALPDTKLSKTFECNCGSSIEIVSESFTSANTTLKQAITLIASKSYLITIDTVIFCSNYEQVLMGFTSMPNLVIGVNTARIINIPLNNLVPTTIASGSSVITPTKTNPMTIEVVGSVATTITHYFAGLKVSVVEM